MSVQMDYPSMLETCESCARGFEEIEKSLQYWCVDRRPCKTVMNALCKLDGNSGCEYPPLWFTHQAQTFAFASVLCSPETIRQWRKTVKNLSPSASSLISYWESNPPIWCYFTILDVLEHDFFLISDRLTGASIFLYSPSLSLSLIAGREEERKKHFIAFIAPNGMCHQSFGMIHSNNLGASDLDFFCTMLDQQDYMTKGFSSVVNKHYIPFLGIDEVTYVPSMTHGGTWLKTTFNRVRIEGFSTDIAEGEWEIEVKGDAIRATLTGRGGNLGAFIDDDAFWMDLPFSRPSLFLSKSSGEGWITTVGRQSYDPFVKIIRHLHPVIPLDKVIVPDYVVSPAMLHLMSKQKRRVPWYESLKPFELDVLTAEAKKNEEIVASHVRSLGTSSSRARGSSTFKDSSGLTMGRGPVRVGNRLLSPFSSSLFFTIDDKEGKFRRFVSAWNAAFREDHVVLLNVFLLLLWYHCGCYKSIESYGREIAKQVPLSVGKQDDFASSFRLFIRETMIPSGFLMTESGNEERIRPSKLFAETVRRK